MNIYAAASLFAVLILLYWTISEVFTVLFRLIGLPEEKARFQVVSLLTGAGFTTRESEMILSSHSRRRLARITMLFGYVFNITFVSAVVNVFVSIKLRNLGSSVFSLMIPMAAIATVFAITRAPRVRKKIEGKIEQLANRFGGVKNQNGVIRIDQIGPQTIARVTLNYVPEELRNKTLSAMKLKPARNILVLTVERADHSVEQPNAHTKFQYGDRVTVFGDYRQICKVFEAKERFTDG